MLAATASFLLPGTYTATAPMLPPEEKSSGLAALLSGQLGGLAGLARASLGLPTNAYLMVGMLPFRTITHRIIDRFDLLTVCDAERRGRTPRRQRSRPLVHDRGAVSHRACSSLESRGRTNVLSHRGTRGLRA